MQCRLVLIAIAWSLFTISCAQVEGTGRRQILLTSADAENKQGATAFSKIVATETVSQDREMTAIIERVGNRLSAVAPDRGFDWEFTLLESNSVNAFALPGGKIAFYTGILASCQNEAGLAVVMGHEIAHVIARHGGERMSHGILTSIGGLTLDVLLQQNDVEPSEKNLWMSAFALGSQVGFSLPYSRKHELEADYLGLMYMAKAGYDPREAPLFWQRMSQLGGGQLEFLSTHPMSDKRARELAAAMDEALVHYQAAPQQYGKGVTVPTRYFSVTE